MVERGEALSLVIFMDKYRKWLLQRARRVCNTNGLVDPEDLVQDAIERLYEVSERRPDRLPHERARWAWMETTMKRLFFDRAKRERREAELGGNLAVVVGEESEQMVFPKLDSEAISEEQFAAAIRRLSPPQRAAFELWASGKKHREIAEELGIQTNAVSKRLHDARLKLVQLLTPYTR
jgi:RNA polymerase sigma factor (sigma-70 family)